MTAALAAACNRAKRSSIEPLSPRCRAILYKISNMNSQIFFISSHVISCFQRRLIDYSFETLFHDYSFEEGDFLPINWRTSEAP